MTELWAGSRFSSGTDMDAMREAFDLQAYADVVAHGQAQWESRSPLTDSNRRPPPYHAVSDRCRGVADGCGSA
jgi:hypothetical protein